MISSEGGFSNPPLRPIADGGLENPRSENMFVDFHAEIVQWSHRLPHWEQTNKCYFVTWRLYDSIPQTKLNEWQRSRELWSMKHPMPWDESAEAEYHELFTTRIDDWLDQGMGSCVLRDPHIARIVDSALRYFDNERYTLFAHVVMPNHVHALFRLLPPHKLREVLKSWKGYSAREINKSLGKSGPLWQEDYWDRLIRSPQHFDDCVEYIRQNPARARLAAGEYILSVPASEGGFSNPPF